MQKLPKDRDCILLVFIFLVSRVCLASVNTHPISIHLLKEGGMGIKASGGDPGSFGTGKVSCTFTTVAFGISSTTTTAVDGRIRREGEEKDTERRDQE